MAAGLTLQGIREALAAQIKANVARGTSVHPYPPGDHTQPAIVIRAADDYVSYFQTMGPNGLADVLLEVDVEVATAQVKSAYIAMDDYLSIGQGNTSSVIDAIHFGRGGSTGSAGALGGIVADCVCLTADGPQEREDGVLVATVHVQIIVHKIGANP